MSDSDMDKSLFVCSSDDNSGDNSDSNSDDNSDGNLNDNSNDNSKDNSKGNSKGKSKDNSDGNSDNKSDSNSDNNSDGDSDSNSDSKSKDKSKDKSDKKNNSDEDSNKDSDEDSNKDSGEDSDEDSGEDSDEDSKSDESDNEEQLNSKQQTKVKPNDLPLDINLDDIDSIITSVKETDNLNRIISQIIGIDESVNTSWGHKKYTSIKLMFDFLNLFTATSEQLTDNKDIYKMCKFKIKGLTCRKQIKNITKAGIKQYSETIEESVAAELKEQKYETIDELFDFMKNNGESFWSIIDLIFNTVYPKAEFENIPDTNDSNFSSQQNNLYGIKLFELVTNEYITDEYNFNGFVN